VAPSVIVKLMCRCPDTTDVPPAPAVMACTDEMSPSGAITSHSPPFVMASMLVIR
jgi:hypothetical protein